jgi:hypothetical protein
MCNAHATAWAIVYLLLGYTSASLTVNIVPRFFYAKKSGIVEENFRDHLILLCVIKGEHRKF